MKKIIRKIKMMWWKRFNPQRYYKEFWEEVFCGLSESCNRVMMAFHEFGESLNDFIERRRSEEGQKEVMPEDSKNV